MMNTHKAFKRLQRAGINDRQAEAMVDIFSALKQDNALSRADVMQAFQRQNQHIFSLSTQLKKTESCLRTETGEVAKGVECLQTVTGGLITDGSVLKTDVAELKTDVAELKTDVSVLKTDVSVLKTDVAELKTDVAELKTDVAELKTDVSVLKTDVAELKTDVSVLKTDVGSLKNDMRWVQRLLMIMTTTLLMATIKYVLA
ncbi:hypothetical protein ACWXWI_07635 [Pantoea ananatis]